MPPKRARTAPKAPSLEAPKTRTTRSRATAKETPVEDGEEATGDVELVWSSAKKTRNRTSAQDEDIEERAEVAEPKTVKKQLPRGRARPPKTVKKTAQSEANKAALEDLKRRMEEDARRLKEGDAPTSAPPETEVAVQDEAEANIAAAAEVQAAPGLPPTNISPPARRTRTAPRTLQRKAPSTVQRGAPATAQKAVPGSAARPQSSLKVQSTPGVENSVLALANFRRRPRQPSLLAMVQNPELAQDLGDDSTEFNTEFTLGASDDEDEFAPYDESTPLQVSKAQPIPPSAQAPRSAAGTPDPIAQQQAGGDTDSLYNATPLPSPKPRSSRKRNSDAMEDEDPTHPAVQIPRSQPSPIAHQLRSSSPLSTPASPNDFDTVPATAPSRTATPTPQRDMSPTAASPLSSSPPASPIVPSQEPLRQTPSPTTRRKQVKPKPLTTATLRAMLPKRRYQLEAADKERERERHEYDLTSSSLSSSIEEVSEDEYSGSRRKKGGVTGPRKGKTGAKVGALSPVAKRKPGTVATAGVKKKPVPQVKKTYSRVVDVDSSDKENTATTVTTITKRRNILDESSELSELDSADVTTPPDTSIETIRGVGPKVSRNVEPVSKELKERKQFFQEVDDWDMEFESMSGGGVESSPAWR